jgi:hypothetical protein
MKDKDNKHFLQNSNDDSSEEYSIEDSKGNGVDTRSVSEKDYSDNMKKYAKENGIEVHISTTYIGTQEQLTGLKNEDENFEKKFTDVKNPYRFSDEGLMVNFKHLNERKSIPEIEAELFQCNTHIAEIRQDCFEKCEIFGKKAFKEMWFKEYKHINKEYITFLMEKYKIKRAG